MIKMINLLVLANGTSKGRKISCISMMEKEEEAWENTCSSSSSSSIGQNSDISSMVKDDNGDIDEVQSSYKGPLDAMGALEEVLPIRRGISSFYNGKSKSFACLSDANSIASSTKALAKPENGYTRRRRNLLSTNIFLNSKNGSGISKRVASNPTRSTTARSIAVSRRSSWKSLSFADFRRCTSCSAHCTHA